MLAKINHLFRLTRDMEVSVSQSGMAVGSMGLACSEKYKDKETQLFLDAKCFGKVAEILQQYAGTKGTQVMLSGKLQTEQWEDRNTGQKRSKVVMIVEGFDFVSGGGRDQQRPAQQQQPAPQYQPNDFDSLDTPF